MQGKDITELDIIMAEYGSLIEPPSVGVWEFWLSRVRNGGDILAAYICAQHVREGRLSRELVPRVVWRRSPDFPGGTWIGIDSLDDDDR